MIILYFILLYLAHKRHIIYYWHVANQYLTKNTTNVGLLQHTILTVMMSPPSSPRTQLRRIRTSLGPTETRETFKGVTFRGWGLETQVAPVPSERASICNNV